MAFTQDDADTMILNYLLKECDGIQAHFEADNELPDYIVKMVLEALVRQQRKFRDQIAWLNNGKR